LFQVGQLAGQRLQPRLAHRGRSLGLAVALEIGRGVAGRRQGRIQPDGGQFNAFWQGQLSLPRGDLRGQGQDPLAAGPQPFDLRGRSQLAFNRGLALLQPAHGPLDAGLHLPPRRRVAVTSRLRLLAVELLHGQADAGQRFDLSLAVLAEQVGGKGDGSAGRSAGKTGLPSARGQHLHPGGHRLDQRHQLSYLTRPRLRVAQAALHHLTRGQRADPLQAIDQNPPQRRLRRRRGQQARGLGQVECVGGQAILCGRRLVELAGQSRADRALLRAMAVQAFQDAEVVHPAHQQQIRPAADQLHDDGGLAELRMLTVQPQHALPGGLANRCQRRAAHVFAQQLQQRRGGVYPAPRLVAQQMDARRLGVRGQQQIMPAAACVDLQRQAGRVHLQHLLHAARRDRPAQLIGYGGRRPKIISHSSLQRIKPISAIHDFCAKML